MLAKILSRLFLQIYFGACAAFTLSSTHVEGNQGAQCVVPGTTHKARDVQLLPLRERLFAHLLNRPDHLSLSSVDKLLHFVKKIGLRKTLRISSSLDVPASPRAIFPAVPHPALTAAFFASAGVSATFWCSLSSGLSPPFRPYTL